MVEASGGRGASTFSYTSSIASNGCPTVGGSRLGIAAPPHSNGSAPGISHMGSLNNGKLIGNGGPLNNGDHLHLGNGGVMNNSGPLNNGGHHLSNGGPINNGGHLVNGGLVGNGGPIMNTNNYAMNGGGSSIIGATRDISTTFMRSAASSGALLPRYGNNSASNGIPTAASSYGNNSVNGSGSNIGPTATVSYGNLPYVRPGITNGVINNSVNNSTLIAAACDDPSAVVSDNNNVNHNYRTGVSNYRVNERGVISGGVNAGHYRLNQSCFNSYNNYNRRFSEIPEEEGDPSSPCLTRSSSGSDPARHNGANGSNENVNSDMNNSALRNNPIDISCNYNGDASSLVNGNSNASERSTNSEPKSANEGNAIGRVSSGEGGSAGKRTAPSALQGILRQPAAPPVSAATASVSAVTTNAFNKVVRIAPPTVGSRHSSQRTTSSSGLAETNSRRKEDSVCGRSYIKNTNSGPSDEIIVVGEDDGRPTRNVGQSEGRTAKTAANEGRVGTSNGNTGKPLTPGQELQRAARVGDMGKIQTLLGKPPGNPTAAALVNTLDEMGRSSLLVAACEGRVAAVRLLHRHGANVDLQDTQHGNTALHEAAWKGYSESCAVLVRARADLGLRNRAGFAALHLACQAGHNQSCRELLLAGGCPDIKNNYGDTPLHTAARYGHAGVTRILLSARAKVHLTNKNGDGGLHIAAAMGRRKLTKILLEAGADQTFTNKQNETPGDIARRKNFAQILAILENPPVVVSQQERLTREKRHSKHANAAATATSPTNDKLNPDGDKRNATTGGGGDKRNAANPKHKRNNDSGNSSKDSSTRHKEKKKRGEGKDRPKGPTTVHWSPYGCTHYPPLELPPTHPPPPPNHLKTGEQYFVDLAGNIKKGPVAVGTACYCAPLLRKVETKLESDKVALMDHIDAHHEKLDARIHSLERKTHSHISQLKDTVQKKMNEENKNCLQRTGHVTEVREARLEAHGRHLQRWVEDRLASHDPALPPRGRPPTSTHPLTRSRSEEAITEVTAEGAQEAQYNGLRVLDHPTTSMYNLHQPMDESETQEECNDTVSHGGHETVLQVHRDPEEPQTLDVTEDSSDSEGEGVDEGGTDDVIDGPAIGVDGCSEAVGRLSLRHPYYANTGAIPKGSASTVIIPPLSPKTICGSDSKGINEEVITVDVHAAPYYNNEPSDNRYNTSYNSTNNEYSQHNSKRYLYDVQEVEPNYGDEAPKDTTAHPDSGCSEESSRSDITDVHPQYPVMKNQYPTTQHQHSAANYSSLYYQSQQPSSSNSASQLSIKPNNTKEYLEPRYQIQHQQQQQCERDAATYLDMDRYRIQQAVRRLYDGYQHDHSRSDPGLARSRSQLVLESSLEHDSHNDSGYSTRMCTASQGPSPALSGASGVLDCGGSGSDTRSGQSTSSPNTTVVAFPHSHARPSGPAAPNAALQSQAHLANTQHSQSRLGGLAPPSTGNAAQHYATPKSISINAQPPPTQCSNTDPSRLNSSASSSSINSHPNFNSQNYSSTSKFNSDGTHGIMPQRTMSSAGIQGNNNTHDNPSSQQQNKVYNGTSNGFYNGQSIPAPPYPYTGDRRHPPVRGLRQGYAPDPPNTSVLDILTLGESSLV